MGACEQGFPAAGGDGVRKLNPSSTTPLLPRGSYSKPDEIRNPRVGALASVLTPALKLV